MLVLLACISHFDSSTFFFFVQQFHLTSWSGDGGEISPANSQEFYRKIRLVRLLTPLSPLSEVLRFKKNEHIRGKRKFV